MMIFELQCDLPDHFKRGDQFEMDDGTGVVYRLLNGEFAEYPLRNGIAGYLNYLRLFGNKYLMALNCSETDEKEGE